MKKRHMLTLTQSNVERFQSLSREVGLPPATLSRAVDDFLRDIVEVMSRAKASGSFTLRDVFAFMGDQLELLGKENQNDKKEAAEAEGKKTDGIVGHEKI